MLARYRLFYIAILRKWSSS